MSSSLVLRVGRHASIAARLAAAAGALALATSFPARAQDADETAQYVAGGAWHYASIPCTEGRVTAVTPRLASVNETKFTAEDFQDSGVSVAIRFATPWKYLAGLTTTEETIVHYQDTPGNRIMQDQRSGDRVQVCLTGFPLPRVDPASKQVLCNPDQDPRGFEFRVYSYRQRAAYIGPNAEHSCGGA